jgi:hypothetical protein
MRKLLSLFTIAMIMLIGAKAALAGAISYTFTGANGEAGTDWTLVDPSGYIPDGTNVVDLVTTSTDFFSFGQDYGPIIGIGDAGEGSGYAQCVGAQCFEINMAITYMGGPYVIPFVFAGVDGTSGKFTDLLTGSTLTIGSLLTLPGGPPSAPVFLLSSSGVAEVTGTIVGQGSQDYYSFFWPGGAFSATTTITGANSSASYAFSEGTIGNCSDGSSVTLNNGDSFGGTIAFANLAAGQYCIGLDANSPNDPSFALTFSSPVDSSPEPGTMVLLGAGLACLGGLRARLKRGLEL